MTTIRKARLSDAQAISDLINSYAAQGLMLHKSLVQVYEQLREFLVVEDTDGMIIGCGALRLMWHDLAEIRSLAIHQRAQGRGLGREIVERLIHEAREMELARVFVLTYQDTFFHKLGFDVVVKQDFPQKVWADCRNCAKRHACDEIAMILVLDESRAQESYEQTDAAYHMLGLPIKDQIVPVETILHPEPRTAVAPPREPLPVVEPIALPQEPLFPVTTPAKEPLIPLSSLLVSAFEEAISL